MKQPKPLEIVDGISEIVRHLATLSHEERALNLHFDCLHQAMSDDPIRSGEDFFSWVEGLGYSLYLEIEPGKKALIVEGIVEPSRDNERELLIDFLKHTEKGFHSHIADRLGTEYWDLFEFSLEDELAILHSKCGVNIDNFDKALSSLDTYEKQKDLVHFAIDCARYESPILPTNEATEAYYIFDCGFFDIPEKIKFALSKKIDIGRIKSSRNASQEDWDM